MRRQPKSEKATKRRKTAKAKEQEQAVPEESGFLPEPSIPANLHVVDVHEPRQEVVKHAGGRPSSYRAEYAQLAESACMAFAATDAELAQFFGVSEQTLNTWKQKHPEFLESIRAGKEVADMKVARSLFDRAVGMTVPKVHFVKEGNNVTAIRHQEYLPPDPKSAIYWLNNRQSGKWRNTVAQDVEVRGLFSIEIHNDLHPDDRKALERRQAIAVRGERLA